jgi:hypothetical protein
VLRYSSNAQPLIVAELTSWMRSVLPALSSGAAHPPSASAAAVGMASVTAKLRLAPTGAVAEPVGAVAAGPRA